MENNEMIKLVNICHSFNNRKVIDGFDLVLNKGDKVIFNAPSGFGKSTIFNIIMGFINPDKGKVYIDNIELTDDTIKEIRNKIAYMPQKLQTPNITIDEFLTSVKSFKNSEFQEEQFNNWILELGLEHILGEKLNALSGGERQRFILSIVMSLNKKIILMDESLSGLDSERSNKVLNLLSKEKELSIIYISHDLSQIGVGDFVELEV